MEGIVRINRVVALFEVWVGEHFPFAKMRVKILSNVGAELTEPTESGEYVAVPNVAVRSAITHEADYISGIGNTIREAVDDLLARFVALAQENTPPNGLTESDFVWSECSDF